MAKTKPQANGLAASDVLTLAEAAQFLKVSEDGLKSEAERGAIPGKRIAGDWRFSQTAILEWLRTIDPVKSTPTDSDIRFVEITDPMVEEQIAQIYAAREALGTIGDCYPDEDQK